ncbi:Nuclear speckle splicing regulatory protein 1 [Halocaridina rubra]|uniref:Nuclear speckle splicing regulatory protein 1 n=1 Tax=Halocaridina rubra TaxID=373956 RepID=A0AAN9A220_HALRR
MMAAKEEKQYGLILPRKNKASTSLGIRKLNPLQDSDEELDKEEESSMNWVEASLKKSAGNSGQQNLQRRMLREALEEDASVFQYDEIYDEMQANKSAQIAAKKQAEEKKPKYIQNILKQAEKRKLEGERRTERKVQKEREDEGDMYADKESFVTPSYLKKMEELKKAEAEAKLEEMQEEKIDVMKHKNFGAFYNHLFKQKMGDVEVKKELSSNGEDDSKVEIIKKREDTKRQKHYRTQRDLSESPEREQKSKPKAPRKQRVSSSDSDEEEETPSYRDRRDKLKLSDKKDDSQRRSEERNERKRERGRSQEDLRGRHKSGDRGKRERSRDRKHKRDKSSEQNRSNRGRHRSRSREQHRRSRSRSPHRRRDERRRRDSRSRSPYKSSKNHDKPKIKEEPKSPNRKNKRERDEHYKNERDDRNSQKTPVKIKKESDLEEKEKRMERIRKLFTKRTVGEKFDQALQRFYIRKAEREANG